MERTKLLTFAVIGLLVLNLLTIGVLLLKTTQSQYSGRSPGPLPGEGPVNVIIERLRFDQAQQQAYRKLIVGHQQQMKILSQQSAQLFRDYYSLLIADTLDSGRANALSQQIAANQRALAQLNLTHFGQIKALCHPNQQADFVQLVDDLSRLFGPRRRPPRPDSPPEGHPEGPPENFPPRP